MTFQRLRFVIILTVVLAPFQNCAPFKSELSQKSTSTTSTSSTASADADMAAKFAATLQPVVRSNCAACHDSIQSPMFAVADALTAYKTIQANALVDLNVPANSHLVQKILGGHNGFSMTVASDLQNAIQAWKDAVSGPVDATAPAVMISAPLAAASLSGTIAVSAIATDNVAVVGVQFYVDGVASGAEDLVSPYSIQLNTASLANGSHILSAKARDAAGNMGTAADVSVMVNNVAPDVIAPTVAITAPTAASTISGAAVTLSATASDNVGVVGVQFLVDGAVSGTEDLTAPYSIVLNTTGLTNGAHLISARARDAAGHVTTAANVSVTVNNPIVNPNASYKWISANILVPKCLSCHTGAGAAKGYKFDSYTTTLTAVVAGNPGASKLYTVTKPGGSMPPGSPLSTVQVQAIFDWITLGAPNN